MPKSITLPSELKEVKELLQWVLDSQEQPPVGFDLDEWLQEWLQRPQPGLAGARPVELLSTPEGIEAVRRLLGSVISGAYQ